MDIDRDRSSFMEFGELFLWIQQSMTSKRLDTLIEMFQHILVNYNTTFIPLYNLQTLTSSHSMTSPVCAWDPLFPLCTGRAVPRLLISTIASSLFW